MWHKTRKIPLFSYNETLYKTRKGIHEARESGKFIFQILCIEFGEKRKIETTEEGVLKPEKMVGYLHLSEPS